MSVVGNTLPRHLGSFSKASCPNRLPASFAGHSSVSSFCPLTVRRFPTRFLSLFPLSCCRLFGISFPSILRRFPPHSAPPASRQQSCPASTSQPPFRPFSSFVVLPPFIPPAATLAPPPLLSLLAPGFAFVWGLLPRCVDRLDYDPALPSVPQSLQSIPCSIGRSMSSYAVLKPCPKHTRRPLVTYRRSSHHRQRFLTRLLSAGSYDSYDSYDSYGRLPRPCLLLTCAPTSPLSFSRLRDVQLVSSSAPSLSCRCLRQWVSSSPRSYARP